MKPERVLLVYKKSAYEGHFARYQHSELQRLVRGGDKGLLGIKRSHDTHYGTLSDIEAVLRQQRITYHKLPRGRRFKARDYDLVLAIGGDGTFLDAARFLKSEPILGVNSDTNHSVGNFCQVERKNFARFFKKILKNQFKIQKINRFRFTVSGRYFPNPVLNEILIAHKSPAAMSHYDLQIGAVKEHQRSSGLWIATAAGSTGAIQSAGGKKLPLTSLALQYRPRELYEGHGVRYKLRGAVLSKNQKIRVQSKMREGMIYVDGAHIQHSFAYGQRLALQSYAYPLRVIRF